MAAPLEELLGQALRSPADIQPRDEAAVLAAHAHDPHVRPTPDTAYRPPVTAPEGWDGTRPVVIGAGPCGLLAALILAEMGLRPIIIERGKAVRERTKDTWGLWRQGVLNPESNAQFGEGGAGTFSDGKLYSRIKDPNNRDRKVLTEFVKAGAPSEILTEAHPHIGTFRLVTMVESMRKSIEGLGGDHPLHPRAVEIGRNLAELDWAAFLEQMISSLPTEAIWITLDKDVLASEDAATNWDQGGMRLTHLLQAIRELAARKRVLGIDVCGEFAKPAFSNAFKRWEAKSDQPPAARWRPAWPATCPTATRSRWPVAAGRWNRPFGRASVSPSGRPGACAGASNSVMSAPAIKVDPAQRSTMALTSSSESPCSMLSFKP